MLDYYTSFCQMKKWKVEKKISLLIALFILSFNSCTWTKNSKQSLSSTKKDDLSKSINELTNEEREKTGGDYKVKSIDHFMWQNLTVTPFWFSSRQPYTMSDQSGSPLLHPFFDLSPTLNKKEQSLNVFIIAPSGQKALYDFDLLSGRSFLRHRLCVQKDIWKKYDGKITTAPYILAMIPRVLDRTGTPVRVLIFGSVEDEDSIALKSKRVKIVGGLLRERCLQVPCFLTDSYSKELLVVATMMDDKKFNKISSLNELKEKIDFNYLISYLQNEEGGVKLQDRTYPHLRVLDEAISPDKVIEFITKKTIVFDKKELDKLLTSCHTVYDFLWDQVGRVKLKQYYKIAYEKIKTVLENDARKLAERDIYLKWRPQKFGHDKLQKELRDPKKMEKNLPNPPLLPTPYLTDFKVEEFDISNAPSVKLKEEATLIESDLNEKGESKKSQPSSDTVLELSKLFKSRLTLFHQNFRDSYLTCIKYVKSSDGKGNYFRHWFYAYIELFYLLRSKGLIYNCSSEEWEPMKSERDKGELFVGSSSRCLPFKFELAFQKALSKINSLYNNHERSYRYLEYDSYYLGTHQKIFSWISEQEKELSCLKDKEITTFRHFNGKDRVMELFPTDVIWPIK